MSSNLVEEKAIPLQKRRPQTPVHPKKKAAQCSNTPLTTTTRAKWWELNHYCLKTWCPYVTAPIFKQLGHKLSYYLSIFLTASLSFQKPIDLATLQDWAANPSNNHEYILKLYLHILSVIIPSLIFQAVHHTHPNTPNTSQ